MLNWISFVVWTTFAKTSSSVRFQDNEETYQIPFYVADNAERNIYISPVPLEYPDQKLTQILAPYFDIKSLQRETFREPHAFVGIYYGRLIVLGKFKVARPPPILKVGKMIFTLRMLGY